MKGYVTSQEFPVLCDLGFANLVNLAFDFLLIASGSLRVFFVIDLHAVLVFIFFLFLFLVFILLLLLLLHFWGTASWSRGSLTRRPLGP